MLDPDVATMLDAVPEFLEPFLALVEAADGDPGAPAVFSELADFVASVLAGAERSPTLLARCLAGVERIASESEEAEQLVGWSFLDALCPEDLDQLSPWLGPRTLELGERLARQR